MKLNVIVIDDSDLQLEIAAKLIRKNEQLNLVGAFSDPFIGLQVANNVDVDLVLLDVEMPEIDGFSLKKFMKDSVEVVLNSTRDSYEVKAYSNGAIDFIVKPLSNSGLDRAVNRVFELQKILKFQMVTKE